MNCHRAERLLLEHIQHRLTPETERQLEQHLAGCPACRARCEAFRRTLALVAHDPVPPAPDPERFLQDVKRRIRKLPARPNPVFGFRLPVLRLVPFGAALAVIIVAGFLLLRPRANEPGYIPAESALTSDTAGLADFLSAEPQSLEELADRQTLDELDSELIQNAEIDDLLEDLSTVEMQELVARLTADSLTVSGVNL
jgi:hypothetical protein